MLRSRKAALGHRRERRLLLEPLEDRRVLSGLELLSSARLDLAPESDDVHGSTGYGPSNNPTWQYTTIRDNGPSSNRIDVVFVGDGYTASELATYAGHVDNIVPSFFAESPLDAYSSFFHVHRVDVTSNESGVDHDPVQGILRDTALDMGFWTGGMERLLGVNVSKALAAASGVDQVMAVANSTKYGGAGYTSSNLATMSGGNTWAAERQHLPSG